MNLRKFCDQKEAFKAWLVEHGSKELWDALDLLQKKIN